MDSTYFLLLWHFSVFIFGCFQKLKFSLKFQRYNFYQNINNTELKFPCGQSPGNSIKAVCCVCVFSHIRLFCHFMDCSSAGSSQWDFSGKNAGVGCHFPLQGIFPTQGSNPHVRCLQRCRRILYLLNHKAMPP